MNDHLDLEVRLYTDRDGALWADLRLATPGNSETIIGKDIRLALDVMTLRELEADERLYGRRLSDIFFASSEMQIAWRQVRALQRDDQNLRLRLFFDFDDERYHLLRWETMLDYASDVELACREDLFFSRYLSTSELPSAISPTLADQRALVVIASPPNLESYGLAPIDVAQFTSETRAALGPIPMTLLASGTADRPTLTAISDALRSDTPYSILYFICHGAMEGEEARLFLENDDGELDLVSAGEVVTLIERQRAAKRPRLVVLAACQSAGDSQGASAMAALGARLARRGALAVLAMQGRVPVKTVRRLMPRFFKRLVEHGEVDRALSDARAGLAGDDAWWMPVLFMRVTNGRIWQSGGAILPPVPPAMAIPSVSTAQPIQRAARPVRIFISYKRGIARDEQLMEQLRESLSAAGHTVFIDQMMPIGMEWRKELARRIDSCDYLVALLSPEAVLSEMVAEELGYAQSHFQATGKAKILPVRVGLSGRLPPQFHRIDDLNYAVWGAQADTAALLASLRAAIEQQSELPEHERPQLTMAVEPGRPLPSADLRQLDDASFRESLELPSGGEDLESRFYIPRDADETLYALLRKERGQTAYVRAAHQTGKTSLLIRGIQYAGERGRRIADLDLQRFDAEHMRSLDSFLLYMARTVVRRLRLDQAEVDRGWRGGMGPKDKISELFEDYILPQAHGRVLLAIDEADRLLQTSYFDDAFGLLRVWHNNRAIGGVWRNLDLLLVMSSEPTLLIRDINQSPFNVGTGIELHDFDPGQVAELNQRYHSPLRDHEIEAACEYLGGHPYLIRRALYTMVSERLSWDAFVGVAARLDGPFGDHLKRYLWRFEQHPELADELRRLLQGQACSSREMAYRLSRAGLVVSVGTRDRFRCKLYEIFFWEKIGRG